MLTTAGYDSLQTIAVLELLQSGGAENVDRGYAVAGVRVGSDEFEEPFASLLVDDRKVESEHLNLK